MSSQRHISIASRLTLLLVVLCCCHCSEPQAPIPVDAFFPDGSWVLYDMSVKESDTPDLTGTLKVSIVGHEKISGTNYFWLELEQNASTGKLITKILANKLDKVDFTKSFVFWGDVKRVIIKENDQKAAEVQELQLKKYLPVFVESKKTRRFGKAEDTNEPTIEHLASEELTVNGKTLTCEHIKEQRQFVSRVNLGFINMEDQTQSSSEYWTSGKVPFGGLVKVIHSSSTLSINKKKPEQSQESPSTYAATFTLKDFSSMGAVSTIKENPEMMQAPVFPFLKDKQQLKPGAAPQDKANVQPPQAPQNQPQSPKKDSGFVPLKKK